LKPHKTLKTSGYRRRYSAFVRPNHAYFKFDSNKAQDKIEALEGDIEQVKHNLEHLIDFIAYFTKLKRYGKDVNAKQNFNFDDIEATKVVLRNTN
jgi:topoisomerase-4 subunit A